MGGSKYNRLLGNKFIAKYKNSLAYLSSSKKSSQKEVNYNYLQQSIIPTMHFQKSLTKLQIPKLDDTMNRYLNSLKPLLNEQDWLEAEKITREFEKNEAVELDREVRELDKQDKNGNYISEPWFDMYLKARESVVLNYNPFIIFQPDPVKAQNDQAIRAANFLISSMRFMKSLRANKLKPEIFHLNPEKSETVFFERLMRIIPESVSFYGAYMFNAYPLDMSQYFRLFNSTRIPKKGKDILFADPNQKHILIIHKGNFYVFPLLDDSGNILSPEHVYGCIKYILESNAPPAEHSLGVLTSENRDTWASVREHLESLGDNQKHLRAIDTAFFCLCLDDFESNKEEEHGANSLTGDAKNRWFDKNLQLIFTKDGQVSINFEHSWGDGVAIVRLLNELYDDTTKRPFVNSKTKPALDKEKLEKMIRKLDFAIDDKIKAAIQQANKAYVDAQSSVKLKAFNNPNYGRSFVKNYNISPDLVMQSGIQIAYYKTFGHFVSTYESASTSAFKLGRTETVRPLTVQTRRLAEYMDRAASKQDSNEIMKLMKEASKAHNQLVKEGAMGQGFDRHLFALKYHATNRRKQTKLPIFYESHAYKLINHNILSTSTLAYPSIQMGGFAPVVPDGFGIGYRILDDSLGACVSCYDSDKLHKFASSLEETYCHLHSLFKNIKKGSDKEN